MVIISAKVQYKWNTFAARARQNFLSLFIRHPLVTKDDKFLLLDQILRVLWA
jgi:hypothetical protein